jgi:hypothetical protein
MNNSEQWDCKDCKDKSLDKDQAKDELLAKLVAKLMDKMERMEKELQQRDEQTAANSLGFICRSCCQEC